MLKPAIDMLDALQLAELLKDEWLSKEVEALEKAILAHQEGGE